LRNKNLWYRERELRGAADDLEVAETRERFYTRPGGVYLHRDLYKHRVRIDLPNQLPWIYEFLGELG